MSNPAHKLFVTLATVLAAAAVAPTEARAQVTIIRNFGGGAAPGTVAGGGNLVTIFNEAADWWEATLVTTPYTLTINYDWGPLGGGTLGLHSLVSQGGTPNRETEGDITFDNDGSSSWFLDPTPCENSEYSTGPTLSSANLGGGTINTGRTFTGATGAASGRHDLFAVCLHEIGHALGLSSANTSFIAENGDGDIDVTAPRPFPGSAIDTISGAHLDLTSALMYPSISSGLRRLPTQADAVSNAQISQMSNINTLTACPGFGGSPLTTTFANNNGGSVGGAVYFELEATNATGVTITDLDLHTSTSGVAATIDVYLQELPGGAGTMNPAGTWIGPITTGSGTTAGTGNPSNFDLSPDLSLGSGCRFGVAIVANGFGHAYTGTGTSAGITLFQTAHLELLAGQASNAPFAPTFFNPRVVNTNIYYTIGGTCPAMATATTQGQGCVGLYTSFYQEMTPAAMDLDGLQIVGTNSATGYTVSAQTAVINPIGSLGAAVIGPVGDDVSLAMGTLGLVVHSNCQIARGAGNSTNWVPNPNTLLNNPAAAMYAWTDLSPNIAGSGQIWYEQSGNNWQVTYDGVYAFGTTAPSTVQFRGNEANGNFTIAFGTVLHTTGPENWLVGYSNAGPSADPGPRDLTLAGLFPFQTSLFDNLPLTLAAVSPPVLGSPFNLTTSNIEPGAVFHVGIAGVGRTAVPLAFLFNGAHPQCRLNVTLDVLLGPSVIFGGPGSFTWQGMNLTGVSLSGVEVNFQAATLDLSVLSGTTRSSNAVKAITGFF